MIEKSKSVLHFFARHPLLVFVIGAVLLSFLAIVVFGGSNSKEEQSSPENAISNEQPLPEEPREYGGNIFTSPKGKELIRRSRGQASPSNDNDPEAKEAETERIDSMPVIQVLPQYQSGIAIDVINISPDGTPVIEVVRPFGTSQEIAEKIWQDFAKENNDSADRYITIHREE